MTPWQTRLRQFVMASNRVPVLADLYRLPYHAAVRAWIARAGSIPGLQSLHARGSFSSGSWEPGRSDIDLTAIIRPGLTVEQDRETASRVRAGHGALRRWFPMLGEIEILNGAHLAAYASPGWRRHEVHGWKRLWGEKHELPAAGAVDDPLIRALHFYHYACLSLIPRGSRETISRAAAKIGRLIGSGSPAPPCSSPSEFAAGVLPLLDHAARTRDRGEEFDARTLFRQPPTGGIPTLPVPPELRVHWDSFEGGASLPWSPSRPILVLREGLEPPAVAAAAATASRAYPAPLLLTMPVLRVFLQRVEPLLFLSLAGSRASIGPVDVCGHPLFPSRQAFHEAVVSQIGFSFADAYSRESEGPESHEHWVFGWLLRVLRYLEDGTFDLEYHSLRDYMAATSREIRPANTPLERFGQLRWLGSQIAAAIESHQSM